MIGAHRVELTPLLLIPHINKVNSSFDLFSRLSGSFSYSDVFAVLSLLLSTLAASILYVDREQKEQSEQ